MILLVPLSVSYPTYHVTTILPWYLQVWFPSLNPPTNENPTVIDLSLGGFLIHFSHLESKDLVSWIQQNHQAKWRLAWASRSIPRAFCQFFFARHAAISSLGKESDFGSLRACEFSVKEEKSVFSKNTIHYTRLVKYQQQNPVERMAILQEALCKPWHDYAWSSSKCVLPSHLDLYCQPFPSYLQGVSLDCRFRKGCVKGPSWKPNI